MKTIRNVELLQAGIEYNLSTGATTFTPEDLRDVVCAANEDHSIPNPRLKLGHVDPRYNDPKVYDATPSFGKAINLRLNENGMTVLADLAGVPDWLATIMPYAFPSRSIEGFWNVESQAGKTWRFVLSACSLLGVQWPGVTVLEDLPMYYGEEMPSDVVLSDEVVQAVLKAAATKATGGDPNVKLPFLRGSTASANLDDVRRAFYGEYVQTSPEMMMWWVRAVLTDPNELVVEDDQDGQLYKLPFSSDDSGTVTFGDAQPVRIDYIPDTREAVKAAAPHVAATLAIGREVLASWDTRDESVPTTASGGAMDPKAIRERLGLPEDASDEQVQESLRALNEAAGLKLEQEAPAPAAEEKPEAKPVVEEPKPAAVAASNGFTPPPGTVLLDENTWKETQAGLAEVKQFVQSTAQEKREQLVAAAIGDGRIPPASKDHWLAMLEKDPNGEATLASLQKGLVPVTERGHSHAPDTHEVDAALEVETVNDWTRQLFPETRGAVAASQGDIPAIPRIASDGKYRRGALTR